MANQVRRENAHVRSLIRAAGPRGGAMQAVDIIRVHESRIGLFYLLRAVPKISEARARHMLVRCRIDLGERVNSPHVTDRQRQYLIGLLVGHAHGERR